MRRVLLALAFLAACKSSESKLTPPGPPGSATTSAMRDANAGAGAGAAPDGGASSSSLAADLETVRAKHDLPALAIAAWKDGKLLDQAVVGVRKLGDPTLATLDDQWHLGSNTKAMTATLVGIFVDRGKLRWTDTLGQLLGKDLAGKLDPGFKDVTLDQLIRHEAGFAKDEPRDVWKQLWIDGAAPDARAKYVRAILSQKPDHAPGTFTYANTSYIVAGYILELKSGKRWEDLIQTELWSKLDMKSCGFGAPGTKATLDQPRGHDAGNTPIEPVPGGSSDNPPGLGPAGTAHCSIADYGKFLNFYATGTPALVTPETMQHLTTARDPNMGYAGGWMVLTKGSRSMLTHSGSNSMWYVIALVFPSPHMAIMIATNKGEPKLEESVFDLIGRWMPKPPAAGSAAP